MCLSLKVRGVRFTYTFIIHVFVVTFTPWKHAVLPNEATPSDEQIQVSFLNFSGLCVIYDCTHRASAGANRAYGVKNE